MTSYFDTPAPARLPRLPRLATLYRRARAAFGTPRPLPPSHRYLARAIEQQFPRTAGGVALAVNCPDDESFGAEQLLLYAQSLQQELECSVLAVDARAVARRPGITQVLGLGQAAGYAEHLLDSAASLDALVRSSGVPEVWALAQGAAMPSLLSVQRPDVDRLLAQAKQRFDYILLHVGAVTEDTRNLVVASRTDGVLLIAREHRTLMSALDASQDLLAGNGVGMVHVVLATH